MAGKGKSRDVSAKEAVECIRGPMTNQELLDKFKISPKGFGDLLKQLLLKKLITEQDLTSRGISIKITKPEPSTPKLRKPKPRKPKPKPKPLIAPEPDPFDSDFLDTVTLTEMLSFKPSEAPPPRTQSDAQEVPPPPNDEEPIEVEDKKGKFSFTGLFKKER